MLDVESSVRVVFHLFKTVTVRGRVFRAFGSQSSRNITRPVILWVNPTVGYKPGHASSWLSCSLQNVCESFFFYALRVFHDAIIPVASVRSWFGSSVHFFPSTSTALETHCRCSLSRVNCFQFIDTSIVRMKI